jgi:hypothetical protein
VLVGAGENLLKDILGVVLREPIGLARDRVHVAGEALNEHGPGALVAVSASAHKVSVAERRRDGRWGHALAHRK